MKLKLSKTAAWTSKTNLWSNSTILWTCILRTMTPWLLWWTTLSTNRCNKKFITRINTISRRLREDFRLRSQSLDKKSKINSTQLLIKMTLRGYFRRGHMGCLLCSPGQNSSRTWRWNLGMSGKTFTECWHTMINKMKGRAVSSTLTWFARSIMCIYQTTTWRS